jgi:hypothetical protein
VTALVAAPRSGSSTGTCAGGAPGEPPRPQPGIAALVAARTASWTPPAGCAHCAHGGARSAAGRFGPEGRPCADRAGGARSGRPRSRRARAAAGPASCVKRPAGAGRAHGRGRRESRRAPAWCAGSCADTRAWGCAHGAGRPTPTGRSFKPTTSPPAWTDHHRGWRTSSRTWPPDTAWAEPAP